jgi:Tfp pilus assembly protein PilZ
MDVPTSPYNRLGVRQIREKRKYPRKTCFMAVDYVFQGRAYTDFIGNTSRGGVFIETRSFFLVGERVSLTFMPPNYHRSIRTGGKVVRTSPQGIGVKCRE